MITNEGRSTAAPIVKEVRARPVPWMGIDMCVDMRIDMCADMCIDMCTDMCIDKCIDMCADMCIDMCINMCIDVCMDMLPARITRVVEYVGGWERQDYILAQDDLDRHCGMWDHGLLTHAMPI